MKSLESIPHESRINTIDQVEVKPIQEQANFKGNYSELLFSRLQNPTIKKQLIDLVVANEKWIEANPGTESVIKKDPSTGFGMEDDNGFPIFIRVPAVYIPKTREQIEADINGALVKQMSVTQIDFKKTIMESGSTLVEAFQDDHNPQNRDATIGIKNLGIQPSLSENDIRNRSMVEAHEKGHVFRHFKSSDYLKQKFSSAFDTSNFNPNVYLSGNLVEGATDAQVKESADEYLFNFSQPSELIERMSQLKGYFGMGGDEKFTLKHLQYAKENYLKDGMLDNNMQSFFDSITEKTEFEFLKLINSVGV